MDRRTSSTQAFTSVLQEISSTHRALRPLFPALHSIHHALRPITQFTQQFSEYPEDMRVSMRRLAASGWYIDPEMALAAPQEFSRRLSEENGDDAIANYYRERITEIEVMLCERYTHRRIVIGDAFDAHREGKYSLSIPVFLAQSDGIWWDSFSTNLFRGNQRAPTANEHLEGLENSISEAIFQLFLESIPLWQNKSERIQPFNGLNRHQILHGEITNYGSEIASLKCISFLSFLCWALNPNVEEHEQDEQ